MKTTVLSLCLAVAVVPTGYAALGEAPLAAPSQPEGPAHVVAKLVKEMTVAEPGKTAWLGVHLKIDKEWHIYWDGRNDTGMPPEFKVTLPDGWTMGKARWCTPERHASEGDIVDYIYENGTLVMLPLEVPKNVAVGEVVEVKIDASWLVCSNVCLPEKQELTAQVRVGTPGAAKPVATQVENFAKARAHWPKPLAEAGDALTVKIEGTRLKVNAKDADRVVFMPASSGIPLANAFAEGEAKGAELVAELGEPDGSAHNVVGIVQLWKGKESTSFWVDLALSAEKGNGTDTKHVEPQGTPAP